MTKQPTTTSAASLRGTPIQSRTTLPGNCFRPEVNGQKFSIAHVVNALRALIVIFAVAGIADRAAGQAHFQHAGKLPPGAIGSQQLLRGGPLPGYFQPVEVKAPRRALVSFALDNSFSAEQATPVKVALLIAPVYRLKVTEIPNHLGEEVYPTVEIINRIYPPVGEEFRFPIPIELTQADLELALAGKFVTRIVYLEDPNQAPPLNKGLDTDQTYFEVQPTDDPLEVADRLGRPVAIIRMGGRIPESTGPDARFMYNSPPLLIPNSLDLHQRSAPAPEAIDSPPAPAGKTAGRHVNSARNLAASQQAPLSALARRAQPTVRTRDEHVATAAASSAVPTSEWQLNKPAPVAVSVSDDQ